MDFPLEFTPPRRKGIVFFLGSALLLTGLSGFLLLFALDQKSSGYFVLALLGALVVLIPVPFILYNAYALLRAKYILDREGLKLRWGLRIEDIPLPDIEWVRPASELNTPIPYPAWSFSGILRGVRHLTDLGELEFLASDKSKLLLVAAPNVVFAISPSKTVDFLKAFQYVFELGSISPLKPISSKAGNFINQVWMNRPARAMILMGIFITLVLLVAVSMMIPTRQSIFLGFQPSTRPPEPAPADRLLMLPVLSLFTLATDLVLGFFLFRRKEFKILSYLVLGSSLITPLLMLVALLFIR